MLPDQGTDDRNGYKDATTCPHAIEQWAATLDDPQIGVACAASGLVVVDIDDVEAWRQFLSDHGLPVPETARVITPSGGMHFCFRAGPGARYGGKLCVGVGYVLAPFGRLVEASGMRRYLPVGPGERPAGRRAGLARDDRRPPWHEPCRAHGRPIPDLAEGGRRRVNDMGPTVFRACAKPAGGAPSARPRPRRRYKT
ncbi:bifunctional DNA primase/polymerase [Amaricoccus solimangrovi]|uniref:Bifunctional DNA primase/polymerase n=1 Tax=Amaricoccus solimangrovi TaxID=2589815 RepID=A0A501WPA9_9RHOB|nr:bifunctional DNA primase/polymerase [Amaricoccus solimangrovi]